MSKYGPKAQAKIHQVLREFEQGKLRNGATGEKVTDREQAIAIGISEARKAGYKTPPARR